MQSNSVNCPDHKCQTLSWSTDGLHKCCKRNLFAACSYVVVRLWWYSLTQFHLKSCLKEFVFVPVGAIFLMHFTWSIHLQGKRQIISRSEMPALMRDVPLSRDRTSCATVVATRIISTSWITAAVDLGWDSWGNTSPSRHNIGAPLESSSSRNVSNPTTVAKSS